MHNAIFYTISKGCLQRFIHLCTVHRLVKFDSCHALLGNPIHKRECMERKIDRQENKSTYSPVCLDAFKRYTTHRTKDRHLRNKCKRLTKFGKHLRAIHVGCQTHQINLVNILYIVDFLFIQPSTFKRALVFILLFFSILFVCLWDGWLVLGVIEHLVRIVWRPQLLLSI